MNVLAVMTASISPQIKDALKNVKKELSSQKPEYAQPVTNLAELVMVLVRDRVYPV
jgi:hypothetical protein